MYKLLRIILFKIDPEKAHNIAIKLLQYFPNFFTCLIENKEYKNLQQNIFSINFPNPIGMAAGFDKNAEIIKALKQFGFGFIEVGTVTIKPQSGNEKPRIFRLEKDNAIINRLGFNNKGCNYFEKNLDRDYNIVLGINIGKNKDSKDSIQDYTKLLEKFYNKASYITINISSPNTKNLRDLQKQDQLEILVCEINKTRNLLEKNNNKRTPIFIKIAPDLDIEEQKSISEIALKFKVDALIISNTTINRNFNLKSANSDESGGLSGKPLFALSNEVLKNIYKFSDGKITLIAVGGIFCANDIYEKIKCGASLVQIYSCLIYQGFGAVEKFKKDLSLLVEKDGFSNISQAIGLYHK